MVTWPLCFGPVVAEFTLVAAHGRGDLATMRKRETGRGLDPNSPFRVTSLVT